MSQTDRFSMRVAPKPTRRAVIPDRPAKKTPPPKLPTDRILPSYEEPDPQDAPAPAVQRLQAERERLLSEIHQQQIPVPDHPTSGTHMADEASQVQEQITALALRRHLEELLKDLNHALARAEQGVYGVCERCGGSISVERLEALPSTTLCIACAQTRTRPPKVGI